MKYLSANLIVIVLLHFSSNPSDAQVESKISDTDSTQTLKDPNFELLIAASEGDTVQVLKWIEKGANVNYGSIYEEVTPLMYASQNGHLETVRILLRHGAHVNTLPQNHVSALLGACMAGHVFIADTLILNGADVNTKNLEGVTPLMVAAANGDSLMADMLIFYKADLNIQDLEGNTALHYATYYGDTGVTELLVEKQANINIADSQGFTALMIAAQKGYTYFVNLYLLKGAQVDAINENSLTALSLAIINHHQETAKLLIQLGADVNHKISSTRNQYTLAQEYADNDMLQMLQLSGAAKMAARIFDKVIVDLDINGNIDDFMIGGSLSLAGSRYGIELQAGYLTRIWVRSVLYEIDPTTYYQFWEKRSILHLGADKLFKVFKKTVKERSGILCGFDIAYTYGNFRGSEKKPDDSFHFVPKAGLFWNSTSFDVRLNYEYMKLANTDVSPHRINLSLGFNIGTGKSKISLKKEPIW
jgi:ankyrin repeat protein